ncbi:MAG: hypothetical protein PHX43_09600 [Alphaproteobacteria bacterium]|nr:hypothetical protein [Alphaproteobacteria bacterium]
MRILFTTQSESLALFNALLCSLNKKGPIDKAGFIVADSMSYGNWLEAEPEFEDRGHILLKEWEVTAKRGNKPDMDKIAKYEKTLGAEAGLFGAIVADRRLYMGKDCTYAQDYRRRFSDEELWSILQAGIESVEKLFDELKPDILVGFICVTFLDYIAYLVARSRGVRVLNLRPTRIGDRIGFNSTLNDPSPEFAQAYERVLKSGNSEYAEEARKHIIRVRNEHGRYEGVVKPSDKPALKINPKRDSIYRSATRIAQNYMKYRKSISFSDNHVADPLRALIHGAIINPLRAKAANRFLRSRYLHREALKGKSFAFYPLHTEPEVSLLVYGRPYVNQIEIIRMLAMSLPADMILVVKEHPWMVGKRSLGSYKKMLNIPKVVIAHPALEAREIIKSSKMVAVVTGSVALEAAIIGRPVITFGDCPYNALPENMVKRCSDPRKLPQIIREILSGYSSNDKALEAYVAATFEITESVNLYSVLLKKNSVHKDRAGDFDSEIDRLANYAIKYLGKHSNVSPQSANW